MSAYRGQHRQESHRRFALRRLVALVVALLVVVGVGGTVYAITRPGAGKRHLQAAKVTKSVSTTVATTTIPPTTTTTLPPPAEPGGGQTLFPSHRLVAFYGAPATPALGVLGDNPPDQMWPQLASVANAYATPGTVVVPTYELITFAAQASPGPGSTYSAQIPDAEISSYLQVVQAHGGMLILDIQPGRNSLLAEAQALQPWLIQPDVGLALDPEWEIGPTQLPDQQVGHTSAAEINQVSAWLQQLTVANHLPQKLLMIHQFQSQEVPDKPLVVAQPNLAIAFNMDGFGGTPNKESVYQILASDPRFTLGYKLFYKTDEPLQNPAEVLALSPAPGIIEYE